MEVLIVTGLGQLVVALDGVQDVYKRQQLNCFSSGETYTSLKKQLSAPVWQAGPLLTTSTTSASASQSAVMDTTRWTLPLVSPLRQIS